MPSKVEETAVVVQWTLEQIINKLIQGTDIQKYLIEWKHSSSRWTTIIHVLVARLERAVGNHSCKDKIIDQKQRG